MFLFQPHRAARDYRGVSKEFADQIFQEQHSVIPYHAAAFAIYKLDAAIRNGKISAAHGIYKYYTLSAFGHEFSQGKSVFAQNKREQEKIGRAVIAALGDEAQLVKGYKKVAQVLDAMIQKQGILEREKIRDYIRGDGVFKEFDSVMDRWLAAAK